MKGIAEMFAALDGYDRYYDDLVDFDIAKRKRAVQRTAEWRKLNPKKARANLKRSRLRWRKRYPEKWRAKKKRRYERRKKLDAEKLRAQWRKSTAAYRERKRSKTSQSKSSSSSSSS